MGKYLMGVCHFGYGYETFEIEADDKADAVRKGKLYVLRHPIYGSGGITTQTMLSV